MTFDRHHLPENFVWPAYDGRSLGNIPATIAEILDADLQGLPPLAAELWREMSSGAKRVVLFVVDAFGWNLLQAEQAALEPVLAKAAVVAQITSIFPSTTVAAISSLWTGAAPSQHGMMALNLFFPEYATEGQMLSFTPTFGRYPDALVGAGLEPETFLTWPGLADQLGIYGVPTYSYKGREIINSTLSRMHNRGVTRDIGAITLADMLAQLAEHLEAATGERGYYSAYWPTVDQISHYRHWDGAATRAELRSIFRQLRFELLDQLSAQARQDTILFITGDHGHISLPHRIVIEDHPELQQMLFMKPSGEPRITYLFAKHGGIDDVVDYINRECGHGLLAVRAEEALASGLFGPLPAAAVARDRLGDVVVLARDNYALVTRKAATSFARMVGGHGGMTRNEMEIPWIALRLDEW